jgi:hypothetical protein
MPCRQASVSPASLCGSGAPRSGNHALRLQSTRWREGALEHLRVRVSSCCALRASGQQPASAPPFSACCRTMRFHVRGVDHLCVCGSSVSSKLPEQVFPDATPCPAHKAIIDRCRRSILGRAITPATAAFQNMHDAADDTAVVRPLDAPDIRRQMRFDPSPLLVAQPKQVLAHDPQSPSKNESGSHCQSEKINEF